MTYRERRERRAARLRDWATKRESRSASAFAGAKRIADGIPFGQPILIGHHSERHARRDQARIHNGMSKGVEHQHMAESMNGRAGEIERQADHAIYSDDPDAIERLTEKIANLEAQRETMKVRNAEYRKTHRAELAAMPSAWERSQAMPHAAYELQNLGGNIGRLRKRLEYLKGGSSRTAAPETGDTATARSGLTVSAGLTTPSRPGKQPRPVWTVRGDFTRWRSLLTRLGGNWYHGTFSFWDDPTVDIEAACTEAEQESATV
jgi:hypothetical protein